MACDSGPAIMLGVLAVTLTGQPVPATGVILAVLIVASEVLAAHDRREDKLK